MKQTTAILFLLVASVFAKSANEYFVQGAFLYAQAKYPTAAIEVREGLAQHPSDLKLQRLLKRIEEAQKEQKQQNNKENPGSSGNEGNSSSSQGSNQNKGSNGQGSSSSQGASSSAAAQPEPQPPEGQLTKEQAEQMLKDFQENDKDRQRAKRGYGRAVPEKDW